MGELFEKTIQKLEIGAGLATLVASSIYFYKSVLPYMDSDIREQNSIVGPLKIFLLIIFPALLTAVGSYIHAVKQSRFGLIMLLLGSSILTLFFGILLFTFAIFYYYGWLGGLLAITPGVFAALTIYFALRSRKLSSPLA